MNLLLEKRYVQYVRILFMNKMGYKEQILADRIPRHIAIIMDGNGRWAKRQGLARMFGHRQGVETVHHITEAAAELGVQYLTLYAFSTENWNRPKEEVDALMALLVDTIVKETPTLMKNNIRLQTIGDLGRLPQVTRDKFVASAIPGSFGSSVSAAYMAVFTKGKSTFPLKVAGPKSRALVWT